MLRASGLPPACRASWLPLAFLLLPQLPVVTEFRKGLLLDWMAACDGAAAFEFGVEFGTEQDGYVGDPHPDQEDDDASQAAVDLVVVAEVGDVESKQRGGDEPQDDGDEATRADPLEAVLGVRARPEQDGQDQPDDDQQDRPLGDVPYRDGDRADAQRVPRLLRQSPGYQDDDGRRHQQDHRDDGDT